MANIPPAISTAFGALITSYGMVLINRWQKKRIANRINFYKYFITRAILIIPLLLILSCSSVKKTNTETTKESSVFETSTEIKPDTFKNNSEIKNDTVFIMGNERMIETVRIKHDTITKKDSIFIYTVLPATACKNKDVRQSSKITATVQTKKSTSFYAVFFFVV
jgi:hypothetical protein